MRIDCKTYLEVDEIDHLTIRYRRGGPLDRGTAVRMIRRYADRDTQTAKALADTDLRLTALNALTDQALHDLLVRVRNALLDRVL